MLNSLKQQKFIISYFLWVRHPSAAWLDPLSQSLTRVQSMCQQWLQPSQGSTAAGTSYKFTLMELLIECNSPLVLGRDSSVSCHIGLSIEQLTT